MRISASRKWTNGQKYNIIIINIKNTDQVYTNYY